MRQGLSKTIKEYQFLFYLLIISRRNILLIWVVLNSILVHNEMLIFYYTEPSKYIENDKNKDIQAIMKLFFFEIIAVLTQQ